MSIQNIATSSTMNFNFNGVKTHVFGLQGSPFTAVPYTMDFRNLTVEEFRFTPRGAYVDNTKSTNAVTLQMQPTGMQITVPAGALWAIHWPAPKQSWVLISSNSVGTDVTNIWFVDYPIFPYKSDSSVSIAGPIAVTQSGAWNVGITGGSVGLLAGNAIIGQVNQAAGSNPWNVSVSNFPATQTVSGTVNVGNFPTTQPVSGSVSVSNFPATQPVSGSVSVSNFPATQPISGSVSVSNFPATQVVSGTITANQGGAPWSENITQIGGSAISLGQKTSANSLPIVIASDQSEITAVGDATGIACNTLTGTTAQNIGASSNTFIRSMSITVAGAVIASGSVSVEIFDGGGTLRVFATIPIPTTGTFYYPVADGQDLAVPLINGGGQPTMKLSANLTSGAVCVSYSLK